MRDETRNLEHNKHLEMLNDLKCETGSCNSYDHTRQKLKSGHMQLCQSIYAKTLKTIIFALCFVCQVLFRIVTTALINALIEKHKFFRFALQLNS